MHAATVEVMTKKACFESNTAMAVAEAFDIAIQHAQLVTAPLLDVRLAELRSEMNARFAEFRSEMDTRFAELDARWEARFAALESEIDARFLAMDARINALEARMLHGFALMDERMDKKIEALKAELVRWVFLVVLGNTALAAAVNALMNSFQHLH